MSKSNLKYCFAPKETLLSQNPTITITLSSNFDRISTVSSIESSTTISDEPPRTNIQLRPPGFQLPSSTHRGRLDPYGKSY